MTLPRAATRLGLLGLMLPAVAAAAEVPPATWLGIPTWIFGWANLIVFWGFLFRFAGPPLRGFLKNRREQIHSDLERAREQRAEAQQLRDSLVSKIDDLKAEVDRLVVRSEEEGERERGEILEQAEADRERLLQQTASEIDNRVSQARQELAELTSRLAADLARRQVAEQLTADDRRRIFDRDLERLPERAS